MWRGSWPAIGPLVSLEPPATLDGGDVLQLGRKLHVGRSGRTNDAGIEQLRTLTMPFGYEVVPVDFSGCLHLKAPSRPWLNGCCFSNPAWVSPSAFPGHETLPVDSREPGGANALRMVGVVIHPVQFPRTHDRLLQRVFVWSRSIWASLPRRKVRYLLQPPVRLRCASQRLMTAGRNPIGHDRQDFALPADRRIRVDVGSRRAHDDHLEVRDQHDELPSCPRAKNTESRPRGPATTGTRIRSRQTAPRARAAVAGMERVFDPILRQHPGAPHLASFEIQITKHRQVPRGHPRIAAAEVVALRVARPLADGHPERPQQVALGRTRACSSPRRA